MTVDFKAWIQASRLPSQAYIFFPLLLGQVLAFAHWQLFSWGLFLLAQLFGILIQLYIVYGNDYADRESDALNTTYNLYSGGSRVLVQGRVTAHHMRWAIRITVGLNILLAMALALFFELAWAPVFTAGALLLLWAYSYPPLYMSYRGGGELLQTLGVAVLLPVFGYYIQTGTLTQFPFTLLLLLIPNHWACAVGTSLPDYPADRASHKRTAAVLLGPLTARRFVVLLHAVSVALLFALGHVQTLGTAAAVAALPTASIAAMVYYLPTAGTATQQLLLFVTCNVAAVVFYVAGLSAAIAIGAAV